MIYIVIHKIVKAFEIAFENTLFTYFNVQIVHEHEHEHEQCLFNM